MGHFHFLPNRDYQKLYRTINSIASQLGVKLSRNHTYDERGLTDYLLDALQEAFGYLKPKKYYINLHVNKPSEKKTGADILLRVKVNRHEINFDRYVLIQAKKYLTGKGVFSETDIGNTHLSGQVAKMHQYNPEFSYLLFYATEEEPVGNIVTNAPTHELINWGLLPLPLIEELFKGSHFTRPAYIEGNYPLTVLRSKTWEKLHDNNPENILAYSEIFSSFLLDDVITGKLGKEWHPEIEAAQGEFSFVVTISIGQG